MEYEFSIGSFFIGAIIVILGVAFVKWHQWIADNFGHGVSSYDRYKLAAFITCGIGLIVMVNMHDFLFRLLFNAIFPQF